MARDSEITALLHRYQHGEAEAESQLIEAVYGELKLMASRYMRRERGGHTLQTTALVNEAYVKLVQQDGVNWQDRAHFFAAAAQVMRRILVDHARRNLAGKRGGDAPMLALDEALVFAHERSGPLLDLDEALTRLAAKDARAARVIELRFFGGLSTEETAVVMQISDRTVRREWNFARAWLRESLGAAGE